MQKLDAKITSWMRTGDRYVEENLGRAQNACTVCNKNVIYSNMKYHIEAKSLTPDNSVTYVKLHDF